MKEESRAWAPLSPNAVAELLAGLPCPWWLAGGWALDLHCGRQSREHEDIDVVILRRDLPFVQQHLSGWLLMAADPPGALRHWRPGERLAESVQDVWCRPRAASTWAMQLMIIDPVRDQWVYRPEPQVMRPLRELRGPASRPELPVLAPELQLLYKSTRPRPKDERDFDIVVEFLDVDQRRWLREALTMCDPQHEWLSRL